jgi:hypothetical protein
MIGSFCLIQKLLVLVRVARQDADLVEVGMSPLGAIPVRPAVQNT